MEARDVSETGGEGCCELVEESKDGTIYKVYTGSAPSERD